MSMEVKLNEQNSQRADELSRRSGKTADALVNEAFQRFADVAAQDEREEHEKFLAWREALLRIEGMWEHRDDLQDFELIRNSMDRALWDDQ
jgi:hypothetical protein